MEQKGKEPPMTGLMTIRCWACGKLLERHPCSKEADGATMHDLCAPCKTRLDADFRRTR